RGMAIERRVPEPAGALVVGMGDSDELTAQPRTQVLDVGGLESQLPAIEPDGGNIRAAVRGECAMEGNGDGAERRESPCTEGSSSHVATPPGGKQCRASVHRGRRPGQARVLPVGLAPALRASFATRLCMFASYTILRPVRDALGITSGLEKIPYLFWGVFIVMLVLQPLYGWLTSRFPRAVFLPWVYGFFIANLLGFYVWFRLGADRTWIRSEEHTSELQSRFDLVCRLLLEKK